MRTMIVDEQAQGRLAWKCETEDFEFGAQLVVHESELAVFYKDGKAVETLGPGMHTLETGNLPFLRFFTKLKFGRYFHAQVYFINQTVQMAIPWGTREQVDLMAEVRPGYMVPITMGASGSMNLTADPDRSIKFLTYLLGTGRELTRQNIQDMFQDVINMHIKSFLVQAMDQMRLNPFQVSAYLPTLSLAIKHLLAESFLEYGILLRNFTVSQILLPKDNPMVKQSLRLYEQYMAENEDVARKHEIEIKEAEQKIKLAELEGTAKVKEAESDADVSQIKINVDKIRRDMENITSTQEHTFDVLNNMFTHESAGAAGGAVDMTSEMAKLGLGMAMGREAVSMMRDTLNPAAPAPQPPIQQPVQPAPSRLAEQSGAASTWICANCHKENKEKSKFCTKCGTPRPKVKQIWFCGECGSQNDPDDYYCGCCGAPREED